MDVPDRRRRRGWWWVFLVGCCFSLTCLSLPAPTQGQQAQQQHKLATFDGTISQIGPKPQGQHHKHWHPWQHEMEDLLTGGRTYCTSRQPEQCCPGRQDTCTVPILDTVCYCDMFCNRTVTDCCPDFWGYCLGVVPPHGAMTPHPLLTSKPHMPTPQPDAIKNNCLHTGSVHHPQAGIKVNCNNCTCFRVSYPPEYNWKCTQKICVIRQELMDHVNTGMYGWKASNYSQFWGLTLDEGVRYRLGTQRPMETVKRMASMHVHMNDVIPAEFDGRVAWPGVVHGIQDQGNCGASWAFSTTSVASDRLALHSGGRIKDFLSPQNLVSCNKDHHQKGCEGGHLDRAWWYMRRIGVVNNECYPYSSGDSGKTGTCLLPRYKTLGIKVKCPSTKLDSSKSFQASPPYRVAPHEREIMKEIMENGPVQATMEVKEDFFLYKGGVYRYTLPANFLPPNHRKTGFHSVKIIGWGVDTMEGKPLKYWLCANSWGEKWGENGYFRIQRGTNECQIESFVVGVWGKVNGRLVTPIKARRVPKHIHQTNT